MSKSGLTLKQRLTLLEHCLQTDEAALQFFHSSMMKVFLPMPDDDFINEKKAHIKRTKKEIAKIKKQLGK